MYCTTELSFCTIVQTHESYGPITCNASLGSVGAEAIAGPGLGAWAEATAFKAGLGLGPVGASVGLNADTGIGFRGGNFDAHLLGFGVKVGADGLAVDTPVVGANCSVM